MEDKYYIIVYAKTQDKALTKATNILEELISGCYLFDNYHEVQQPVNVLSPEGKILVEKAIKHSENEFKEDIAIVRKVMEKYTDEEIFEEYSKKDSEEDDNLFLIRHRFNELGMYKGSSVYIYNNEGEGIQNRNQLRKVLDTYASTYEDLDVFIVSAMIHY